MGIQAIKGVEIGDGFETARRRGSVAHDEMYPGPGGVMRSTNRAGGLEGGMTNGQPVRVRAAMKPISTVPRALAMGLNTTEKARIFPGDVAELAARAGDSAEEPRLPIVRTVTDALRYYFEFHERYDGFYGAFIHDPLVVAAALDPSLIRTEPAHVDVDTSGGPGDAQTIADWRKLKGKAPNVDVAVEADADEFLRRLVDRVGALAARIG